MVPRIFISILSMLSILSACNLEAEVISVSGVFVCEKDSQCPDGLVCHSYLDVYARWMDSRMQSVAEGKWGLCIRAEEWAQIGRDEVLESCENGRDDDGDGAADCADADCQTAPYCRTWGQTHCEGTTPDGHCEAALGFPTARDGLPPDQDSCPTGPGVIVESADGTTHCLPRCRLRFPDYVPGMQPTDEADFAGSDAYCNAAATPWATHPSFSAGLACQHLGMSRNEVIVDIQEDVCLPTEADLVVDGPTTETCSSVCGGSPCMHVSFPRRELSAFNAATMRIVPISPAEPDEYTRTAIYCLD